ncbi:TPA: hypothetical protein ACRNIQ_004483 [Pseudomonas aeruginosa]|uniref:hypothetical protein n=1 Tax=Pseudomonas aeruginosa TaxID=287 RepID=UPI00129863BA|nr:hypothetical protein [Pseudomonas aeruginosa]MBG4456778.1 hypothetical protein [Pseudomonas aeruginosa]MBG7090221.1 hypothetical protein [Pseudomonas aeruginosa]MBH8788983.1 hypothetical protein [Pseudomonas aeruginosa]MCW5465403.1 hypothetical protein [Pseudomonas aeruginosa]MWW60735.1 hypothetical protein [Pseudomonas aeruginosa]
MQQRTALEQDVIDFAKSIEEIFEKQLELQRNLRELMFAVIERLSQDVNQDLPPLTEFGVNIAHQREAVIDRFGNNRLTNKMRSDLSR